MTCRWHVIHYRAVTEPQREKARLKYNKPPSKSLDTSTTFGAKQHIEIIKMLGGCSVSNKSSQDFFDKLRGTKGAPRAPIPHMR